MLEMMMVMIRSDQGLPTRADNEDEAADNAEQMDDDDGEKNDFMLVKKEK